MFGTIHLGCAGWSLRKEHFTLFEDAGSHLERYASRFNCVEINSSFYKSHRISTYQRWAAATPPEFLFAVKLPKTITHINRLQNSRDDIAQFAAEIAGLGSKLGVVLIQLPPSLAFEPELAADFFDCLDASRLKRVVIEPRHVSWFDSGVETLLAGCGVGRVAADPAVTPAACEPFSASGLTYFRWHGSPRTYYSSYDDESLVSLSQRLAAAANSSEVWCIFDNTAEGAATANALSMQFHLNQAVATEETHATH